RAARTTGRRLGELAYTPLRVRRRTVERQIEVSFPDRHPVWVRETARACYRHFGEEMAALSRPGPAHLRQLLERVRDPAAAPEMLRRAGSRGAVIVTGHLGNWELAGAYLAASGLPVTAVVQRQRGAFDRRVQRLRRQLGIETVYREEPAWRLVRAIRRGRVVALVADQHAARGGAPVLFFGRPASTFLGPARLAIAARAPLFFAGLVREADGYRTLIERVDDGEGPRDELALTRAWVERLEDAVRAHPEQYFWFHRRWKLGESSRAPERRRAGRRRNPAMRSDEA
ncbi:MAG: lysophospholipid acyltransferase family protein, partial [Gemmatimonadota bacterium]